MDLGGVRGRNGEELGRSTKWIEQNILHVRIKFSINKTIKRLGIA